MTELNFHLTEEEINQAVSGMPGALKVKRIGDVGPGGAYHSYLISGFNPNLHPEKRRGYTLPSFLEIFFQHGKLIGNQPNGVTIESLLVPCIDRLEAFQEGPFPCKENQEALEHLKAALEALKSRTRDRIARGVKNQDKE